MQQRMSIILFPIIEKLFLLHVLDFFIVFRGTADAAVEDASDKCEYTK